ncbi:MAG: hypothetical protein E7631_05600 [Ruminococcaceae bacterium]|nr:hypothetical protein [Oscillospiraceae bacterium]
MIYPSIAELTQDGKINRYTLVVATAKCARIITDEYVKQREYAEKVAMNKDSEKSKNVANLIRKEYRDEKAVKNAINGLHSGEFRILSDEEAAELHRKQAEEEERRKAEAAAKAEEEAAALEAEEALADAFDEDDEVTDEDAAAAADALELLLGLGEDEDEE